MCSDVFHDPLTAFETFHLRIPFPYQSAATCSVHPQSFSKTRLSTTFRFYFSEVLLAHILKTHLYMSEDICNDRFRSKASRDQRDPPAITRQYLSIQFDD